jgi:hypothetical protein
MVIVILLKLIPFLGSLLVALLAPILMSSGLLAANDLSKQKMSLPASLRMAAFARSPLALLRPLRDEKYTVTMLILAIYAVTMALLINISLEVISDGAWARDLAVVQGSDFLTALGGKSVACLLYLGLSMSLIYAVPLIVLHTWGVGRPFLRGWAHIVCFCPQQLRSLAHRWCASVTIIHHQLLLQLPHRVPSRLRGTNPGQPPRRLTSESL